jgi:hypothetical protein
MSTTIRRLARWLGGAILVLFVWLLVLIALPLFGGPGRQYAVLGPSERAVRAVVGAGGQLVDVRPGVIIARSDRPGFALALYRQGVPLVVEGRIAAGCLKLAGPPVRG